MPSGSKPLPEPMLTKFSILPCDATRPLYDLSFHWWSHKGHPIPHSGVGRCVVTIVSSLEKSVLRQYFDRQDILNLGSQYRNDIFDFPHHILTPAQQQLQNSWKVSYLSFIITLLGQWSTLTFHGTRPNAHFEKIWTSNTHNSYMTTEFFTRLPVTGG